MAAPLPSPPMFAWIHAMLYMILPDSVPGLRREDIQGLAEIAPADVVELARRGERVPAVAAYRKATRAPLREALAVVKWLERD